jgi:nitroreductase
MSTLLDKMQWRYAAKKMDASKVVSQEKVDRIVEAARLAPTSSGLQPFEVIVVSNKDIRAKIQAAANNQAQITEGSHLLVFAAWDTYTADRQTYIGLGASLIAAAFEEVDSTPMEGFDPKSVNQILGLGAKGLRSVALLPLGYRAKGQDWLENLKKIRRPVSEFVTEVK